MTPDPRAGVLITDAGERSVVAAIRALHAGGYRVAATSHLRLAPGACSRACDAHHRVPDPRQDSAGFVDRLEQIVAGGDHAILLGGGDASLLAISEQRERLQGHVELGLPARETVRAALSKLELTIAAQAVGLRVPRTIPCEGPEQVRAAVAELGLPVLAKSASAVLAQQDRIVRPDTRLIADAASLQAWLAQQPGPSLIQACESGTVLSCAGVMSDSGMLAFAVARYIRTWRPEAGNASFAQTVVPPPDLAELVATLLHRMDWRGIFELEVMTREDGSYVAIDLNPRVYGSLALAVRAGASLPAVWCDSLLGRKVAPRVAEAGFYYRWEEGEARNFAALARRGSARAALDVLRPRRDCVHADFSRSDPAPFAARMLLLARRALAVSARPRAASAVFASVPAQAPAKPTSHASPTSNGSAATRLPVAIIGAGPYGLAVGAHLRDAGIEVRQFGRPMSYWREQMPADMLLRSSMQASSISDPHRALKIERHAQEMGRALGRPITIAEFMQYGDWFQEQTAPDLDERLVTSVERVADGFSLTLQDGERLLAARVVVAAGLFPFARRPAVFGSLSGQDISHASEHVDLSAFNGKRVAVIGSGQSALESAALLGEHGAEVEVIARNPTVVWLGFDPAGETPPPTIHWPKPPTDVGGRVTGWIAAAPESFRAIPSRRARDWVMFRCVRPAGAGWLPDRLRDVPLTLGRTVTSAQRVADHVELGLDDGSTRSVDHVFLGTGYEIDVRRYPFLSPSLAGEIKLARGLPVLGAGLESSVAGLHFVGAPAAGSFGPIMRFVVGTWYAAPAVARRVTGQRRRLLALSY